MTAVTTIKPHLSAVRCPAELRTLPAWVMWRFEHHEDEPKPRKVPFYVNGQRRYGKPGSPDDRRHLATFDAARTAAARKGMDGVGLALLPEWGITALDFDHCVLPDGQLHPEVAEIVGQSYAEWSPSGQGVRVLFKGNLLNRKSFSGDFGFETFSTKGFVTFTGNRLDITDVMGNEDSIADVTPEVTALFTKRFQRTAEDMAPRENVGRLGLTDAELQQALAAVTNADLPYESSEGPSYLGVGMALHHETNGMGFDLWDEWARTSGKYTTPDYGWYKWQRFGTTGADSLTARSLVKWAADAGVFIGPAAPASADEFDVVDTAAEEAKAAEAEAAKPLKFQFEPVGTFASAKGLPWIIKDVLPQAALAVVYGASGSGKTFAVTDLVMAVARGEPWRGKRVKQMPVAYIVAEGAGGFRKRVYAYGHHHGVDLTAVPMHVLGDAPNLLESRDAKELIRALQAIGPVGVVVVDTLAQTTPGANENAGEDMGKALNHCKRIHAATGALVLLVHHSGKDQAKGARGWSGLKGACDAEIEVLRGPTGRKLSLTKAKDGVDGLEWGFDLDVVTLGLDEDGDEITSCVVRETEVPKAALTRVLGPNETVVNAVIQEFAKAQSEGIEIAAVVAEAARRMPEPEPGKRDTRKQRAKRAVENLCLGDDAPYWADDSGCLGVL